MAAKGGARRGIAFAAGKQSMERPKASAVTPKAGFAFRRASVFAYFLRSKSRSKKSFFLFFWLDPKEAKGQGLAPRRPTRALLRAPAKLASAPRRLQTRPGAVPDRQPVGAPAAEPMPVLYVLKKKAPAWQRKAAPGAEVRLPQANKAWSAQGRPRSRQRRDSPSGGQAFLPTFCAQKVGEEKPNSPPPCGGFKQGLALLRTGSRWVPPLRSRCRVSFVLETAEKYRTEQRLSPFGGGGLRIPQDGGGIDFRSY